MTRLVFVSLLGAAGLAAPYLRAQSTFEVASLKPSTSGFNGVRGGCRGIDSSPNPNAPNATTPLGRCVITDGRLSHLIGIAFSLQGLSTLKGAPDWVIGGDERFTIEAKAENPTKATEAELLAMLQGLLVDRFKLKYHREDRDVPGFALVVAKNGPKLQETKSAETSTDFGTMFKPIPGTPITFNARKYSMTKLTGILSAVASGPVVDKTDLKGEYDLKLSWDDSAGPSIFTAVQEQLGLKLEQQKAPVSFFVLESAQRPNAN